MTNWQESLPEDPMYLQAAAELQHRRMARKSLHEFVRQGWAEVEAGLLWIPGTSVPFASTSRP